MHEPHTTAVIQTYLNQLEGRTGEAPAAPVVQALIGRAAERLHVLCASMLHRSYPRLTRPPLNLQSDELLSAVVERLLKALRRTRPGNVRQFFAIANQHLRWELNDLARRLDERTRAVSLREDAARAPESSGSVLSPNARRMLEAIEALPEEEREVFDLVRIQGLTLVETADIVGVATKTVQRRLNRALVLLAETLRDLPAARPEPR